MFEKVWQQKQTLALNKPESGRIWPKAGNEAWHKIDEAKKNLILSWGVESMAAGYPALLARDFLSFTRTGNRRVWETPYFARRKALIGTALSECLEHSDEKIDFVIDGLWLICEESGWMISAHNNKGNAGEESKPLPDKSDPIIDLFAAQTAATLSVIVYLLRERLDQVTPMIADRVLAEIRERILVPFLTRQDYFWMGWTRKILINWTPWILSNILLTAQYSLDHTWELDALVRKAFLILDRYMDSLPEDGGCDEGTAYWNMAGGSLLDCLESLFEMSGSTMDFYHEPKIRQVALFPARAHIAGPWFWNFADCDARPKLDGERLFTFGCRIESQELKALGAYMGSNVLLRDTPQISRVMNALFSRIPEGSDPEAPDSVDLPDLQVYERRKKRLILVIKGGHNGESHNHNDVGNFILYADGNPILVDAGNMVYTRKTFSEERYTLWNVRSLYHNLPFFGEGIEQKAGEAFRASCIKAGPDRIEMELASAYGYPNLLSLRRTVEVSENRISLRDCAVLKEAESMTSVLMTWIRPEEKDGVFRIGPVRMEGVHHCSIETIPVQDERMAENYPGCLYRILIHNQPSVEHTESFRWVLE